MREFLLILCGVLSLGCALGVVFSRNAVYSAFNLILCFFALAAIYVLWNSPFIAMIQILVYTGAIVVLFVFVVMLLNLSLPNQNTYGWLTLGVGGIATWVFSLLLLRTLNHSEFATKVVTTSNLTLKSLSELLFTKYLWPFEVLSVFLLALIIAVFTLARKEKA